VRTVDKNIYVLTMSTVFVTLVAGHEWRTKCLGLVELAQVCSPLLVVVPRDVALEARALLAQASSAQVVEVDLASFVAYSPEWNERWRQTAWLDPLAPLDKKDEALRNESVLAQCVATYAERASKYEVVMAALETS
jgi:hypothetical protein